MKRKETHERKKICILEAIKGTKRKCFLKVWNGVSSTRHWKMSSSFYVSIYSHDAFMSSAYAFLFLSFDLNLREEISSSFFFLYENLINSNDGKMTFPTQFFIYRHFYETLFDLLKIFIYALFWCDFCEESIMYTFCEYRRKRKYK